MLRQALLDRVQRGDRLFRWRGGEVSRVESLTDGVFALALTLLVVPFEVRGADTFAQFETILLRAPVMALCVAFLVMVWQSHFLLHRRYGIEDGVAVWLNAAFLFVLLLGIYPVKLLATLLINSFTGLGDGLALSDLEGRQVVWLMQVYGLGFVALYAALFAMVWRGWVRRDALVLDAAERCLARGELASHGLMIGFGLASIGLAALGRPGYAGVLYMGIGPAQGVLGWRVGARAALLAAERPPDPEIDGAGGPRPASEVL